MCTPASGITGLQDTAIFSFGSFAELLCNMAEMAYTLSSVESPFSYIPLKLGIMCYWALLAIFYY